MKKTAKRILALIMCLLLVGILMAPTLFAAETQPNTPVTDWGNLVSIILTALLVVGGFFISYFKTSAKLKEKAGGLIAEAENQYRDWTKAGGKKFTWVCDQLYNITPVWLKPLLTPSVIESIVQTAFDFIADYAEQQLDKTVGKLNK